MQNLCTKQNNDIKFERKKKSDNVNNAEFPLGSKLTFFSAQ